MNEVWRSVDDFEYEVSDCGSVRSLPRTTVRRNGSPYTIKGKTIAPASTPTGYLFVSLYGEGERQQAYVHQLVASAFIGPRPEGQEINHKDGNKRNNRPDNLEYITSAENMKHARETGLIKQHGEDNPACKYSEQQIRDGYELVKGGMGYRKAANKIGVKEAALWQACRGHNWKSLGLRPLRRKEYV